jgi:hypothetical protein
MQYYAQVQQQWGPILSFKIGFGPTYQKKKNKGWGGP